MIRPVSSAAALTFGRLFHEALAVWFEYPDSRLNKALGAIFVSDADELDKVVASELIIGYDARWSSEQIETVAVERSFEMPLVNPISGATSRTWIVGGKLDLLVKVNGKIMLGEHKTSSENIIPGSVYWQRLQLDSQISTYYAGARAEGFDVEGCMYDVIGKPRIRPYKATAVEARKYKKDGTLYANQHADDESLTEFRTRLHADIAENPDQYYQRGEVYRNYEEERLAACDLWQLALNIRACEKSNAWPRNPDGCWKYQRACDYWPVCIGERSIDDPFMYRKATTQHEELDNESATNVCPF